MRTEEIIRNLNYTIKKHSNDIVGVGQTNIASMCKDILPRMKQLKAYEDAEEQGLLLRLPFEAGKEIYVITKSFDVMKNCMSNIIEVFEVKEFKYNFLKNFVIVGVQKKKGFYERHFFLEEIGKTVFLTKEEAEQKLESMKGESNG